MSKITLGQILQFLNKDNEGGLIQIVTDSREWDDPTEIEVDCELLEPFYGYIVTDIRPELSFLEEEPIIRVGIEKDNIIQMRKI